MASWTLNGRELETCDVDLFRYKEFHLVVVTGASINFCGHALLNIGGHGGYYLHIAGTTKRPHFLDESHYNTYLRGNNKKELFRQKIQISFPQAALLKLENLIAQQWIYGVVVHNCATFVEQVLRAGGANFYITANCPLFYGLALTHLE